MPSTTPTSSSTPTSASRTTPTNSAAPEKPARVAPVKKSAAAKPAADKPARAAKKTTTAKKPSTFEPPAEAHWHRLISEAAYYRAESRGFAAGHEHEDWAWAEEQVRKRLST